MWYINSMEPIPKSSADNIPAPYNTGEARHWYLLNYEQLTRVLEALGCATVRGSQIVAYSYVNTASSYRFEDHTGPMEFEEPTDVPRLLEHIGDIGMNDEFPNNFKIALALQMAGKTRTLIHYECDEQPEVCDECEPTHFDDGRSCEHGSDYVSASYHVAHGEIDDSSIQDAMCFL